MKVIDLNREELDVMESLITDGEMRAMGVEDWRRVRLEKRLQFCELWSEVYDMNEKKRQEFFLCQTLDKNETEEKGKSSEDSSITKDVKASVVRLIETSPEEWAQIPEKTREAAVQRLESMKDESAAKLDTAILEKMPKELAKVMNLTPEEWRELPEGAKDAVLRKMDSLEERVKAGILTSTEEDPAPQTDEVLKVARAYVSGDEGALEKFQKIVEGR